MTNTFLKFFQWFIPENSKHKSEEYYKAKIFIAIGLVSMCISVFFYMLTFFNINIDYNRPQKYHFFLLVNAIALMFSLVLFKYKGNIVWASSIWLFFALVHTLIVIPHSGAIFSPVVFWLSVFPLFSFLLVGWKNGLIWTAIINVCVYTLYWMTIKGYFLHLEPLKQISANDALAGFFSFSFFVSSLIFIFTRYQAILSDELNKGRKVLEEQKQQLEMQAKKLLETQDALEESNKSLEKYAYVASHDLKQPLKTIQGLSGVLTRHLTNESKIDVQSTELIAYIDKCVNNMEHLITGVLDTSRKNHLQQDFKASDLNELVDNVLHNLSNAIQKNAVTIKVETLPELSVIPIQITQVFQNLISNAIKFRDPQRPLKIYITTKEMDECWGFCVKDNGKGIEKQYLQSIFKPFNKLDETANGSGIGLDTCAKIIEKHGGKFWADSKFGEFTTFYFTIKKVGVDPRVHPNQRSDVGADPRVRPSQKHKNL